MYTTLIHRQMAGVFRSRIKGNPADRRAVGFLHVQCFWKGGKSKGLMKNSVLQALADRIHAYYKENPEAMRAAAEQAKGLCSIQANHDAIRAAEQHVRQMQALCARPDSRVRKAFDKINLLSGINNLN